MKKLRKNRTNVVLRLFLILFLFSNFQLMAQRAPSELALSASGGVSMYLFQPNVKESSSIGFISDFGVGFNGFFSQQAGIHISAEFGLFNIRTKAGRLKETITLNQEVFDNKGEKYIYNLHTTLYKYSEAHKSLFLSIPIMFIFQTKQSQGGWSYKQAQRTDFYAMFGAKAIFLFNNKYDAGVNSMYNKAYFPDFGVWIHAPESVGFGEFAGNSSSGKMEFGIMGMASIELGAKWRLDKNICFYTGAFFEFGFNDPIKDSRIPYGNYSQPEDLNDISVLKIANNNFLMAVGIKLRVGFSKRQRTF